MEQIPATLRFDRMEIEKKKVGLFLPVPLADELDQLTARVGKKQKWLIVSAALIRFLQSDENTQNELIRRVKIADLPGGSIKHLIASARDSAGDQPPLSEDRSADFQQLVAIDDASRADPNAAISRHWPRPSPTGIQSRSSDNSKSSRRPRPK